MNTDAPAGRYVTHMLTLPCHVCGVLTTVSRFEQRADGRWVLLPLCQEHRPADLGDLIIIQPSRPS